MGLNIKRNRTSRGKKGTEKSVRVKKVEEDEKGDWSKKTHFKKRKIYIYTIYLYISEKKEKMEKYEKKQTLLVRNIAIDKQVKTSIQKYYYHYYWILTEFTISESD